MCESAGKVEGGGGGGGGLFLSFLPCPLAVYQLGREKKRKGAGFNEKKRLFNQSEERRKKISPATAAEYPRGMHL